MAELSSAQVRLLRDELIETLQGLRRDPDDCAFVAFEDDDLAHVIEGIRKLANAKVNA